MTVNSLSNVQERAAQRLSNIAASLRGFARSNQKKTVISSTLFASSKMMVIFATK
jgi:hypothetical protein